MSIGKISPTVMNNVSTIANSACQKLGSVVNGAISKNKSLAYKGLKAVEPTGFNNSFLTIAGLMVATVIIPRVMTAAKRNPDDLEATKDERFEILFRDVQTVGIILFALKILNTLISAAVGKASGLPMNNKPFLSYDKSAKFKDNMIAFGKNILNTIHPTGGVIAKTQRGVEKQYSNFNTIDDIKKVFEYIKSHKGNSDKVYKNMVLQKIIDKYSNQLADARQAENITNGSHKLENDLLEQNIQKLKDALDKGVAIFDEPEKIDPLVSKELLAFFKDGDNELVKNGTRLNSALRTGALVIESTYLGFGLPALYQRHLEKKYLSGKKKSVNIVSQDCDTFSLIQKKYKNSYENILYKGFIK